MGTYQKVISTELEGIETTIAKTEVVVSEEVKRYLAKEEEPIKPLEDDSIEKG